MIGVPDQYQGAVSFAFGDSPALADALLALVISGVKTATCGALRDYSPEGEPLPVVGRRDIVLDGAGRAAAVIETVEVTIRRFDEVDAAFAHDEGEDDQTLEAWRVGHEVYFARNGGFTPDMELVCERFRLVDILKRDQG
ncbi:ASCH domain-containing protein [Agrobacterium vitis]|uniref:ASCH domain-containing protein n=1 Tax=Agrobacterium vitis TaxID=373 RepID=UPI003D27BFA2